MRGPACPAVALLRTGGPQDIPPQVAGQDLYLRVFVNGQLRHLVARFRDVFIGALSADAEDLRTDTSRRWMPCRAGSALNHIPCLGRRLIAPGQTIRFIVPPGIIVPHELDAGAAAGAANLRSIRAVASC